MAAQIVAFGRKTFSSLKRRNFRLYFTGQGISLTGGWMQSVAQSWLVLHLTGSATALGVVAALQYGPTLFLGPYAGVLADKFPKRRMLFVTQTAMLLIALALGVAVAMGLARPWMVYAMAAVLGLVTAVDYPTRQSFLFELAGPCEIASAVGLNSTANNLARVIGPAIAGVVIAAFGLAACFLINAASFIAVIACLAMMRVSEFHHPARHEEVGGGLAEGFAYSASAPVLREALIMTALIGGFTFEFATTLPAFVKFSLGMNAAGLAVLMSAMGVGAALGGLVTAGRRGDGMGRLALGALGFGVTTGLVGLMPSIHTAAAMMFFVGVFSARFGGLSNQLVQLRSKPLMRNRVMALWSTAMLGSTFLGAPLVGWIAEAAGPRWALGVGAVGGLLAAAVGWAGMRRAADAQQHQLSKGAPAHKSAA